MRDDEAMVTVTIRRKGFPEVKQSVLFTKGHERVADKLGVALRKTLLRLFEDKWVVWENGSPTFYRRSLIEPEEFAHDPSEELQEAWGTTE